MIKKLLIINLISIGTAQADFAGEFAPLNWTTATGGGDGSVSPAGADSVLITGNNNGDPNILTSYTISAYQAGYVNYDWLYTTDDGPSYDKLFFLNNGVESELTDPFGGQPQVGNERVLVEKGQIFGFGINSTDGCCGPGFVSIRNFIFETLAPSAASTLASMTTTSQAIGSQIAGFAMSTNYANMNTYDCGLFDQDGVCFSVGGRYSDVNGTNNTDSSSSALVAVGGYKFNNHFRIAGFIDQQVNSSTPNSINLDNKGPLVGMSLVWNQHPDHLGYQVKVANAYQSKDLSITRTATGDAEAGRGDTSMEVQSYVAEVSYQFSDGVKTFYRPYVAVRRAIIQQDGYTETGVDNPLTFNTLEDKSTTVIMGMKLKYKLSNQVTLNGALGAEHDVDNDIDKLQATSSTITGLTAVDINSSINKTRPVATLGATYHISPNQTLSAQTQYQELAYTSTSAKTAYVNYTVGF